MISGLVATLAANATHAQSALQAIGLHPALELGPQDGCRLPLVLETATPAESHDLTNWLSELPGVEHVDVVYVDLEDNLEPLPEPKIPLPGPLPREGSGEGDRL